MFCGGEGISLKKMLTHHPLFKKPLNLTEFFFTCTFLEFVLHHPLWVLISTVITLFFHFCSPPPKKKKSTSILHSPPQTSNGQLLNICCFRKCLCTRITSVFSQKFLYEIAIQYTLLIQKVYFVVQHNWKLLKKECIVCNVSCDMYECLQFVDCRAVIQSKI